MTGAIEIREGSPLDLELVMTVMHKAFEPHHGEAWTATQCAGALSLPGSILLLARDDSRTTGFALARSVADEAELLLIAVRPDSRRRGAGQRLVTHIIDHYCGKGVKMLHLEVRTDNPALSFYSHLGFERVGLRRNYYRRSDGQLTDAATLSLKIARF